MNSQNIIFYILFFVTLFKVGVTTNPTTATVRDDEVNSNHLLLEIIGIGKCSERNQGDNSEDIIQVPYPQELNTCFIIKSNGLDLIDILNLFRKLGSQNKEVILIGIQAINQIKKFINEGKELPEGYETSGIQYYLNEFDSYLTATPDEDLTSRNPNLATTAVELNFNILLDLEDNAGGLAAKDILIKSSYMASTPNALPIKLFTYHPARDVRENALKAILLLHSYGLVEVEKVRPDYFTVPAFVAIFFTEWDEGDCKDTEGAFGTVELMRRYLCREPELTPAMLIHIQTLLTHLLRLEALATAIEFYDEVCVKLHDSKQFDELVAFAAHVNNLLIGNANVDEFEKLNSKRWLGLGWKGLGKYEQAIEILDDTYQISFKNYKVDEESMKTVIDEIYIMYPYTGKYSEALTHLQNIMYIMGEVEETRSVYLYLLDRILSTISAYASYSKSKLAQFLTRSPSLIPVLKAHRMLYEWEFKKYGESDDQRRKITEAIRELEHLLRSE